MTEKKKDKKKEESKVKTFSVPFASIEVNQKINVNTIINSNQYKEKIIIKAIELHQKGNALKAERYYRYCIDQGFTDQIIFSNYGLILKKLGK